MENISEWIENNILRWVIGSEKKKEQMNWRWGSQWKGYEFMSYKVYDNRMIQLEIIVVLDQREYQKGVDSY